MATDPARAASERIRRTPGRSGWRPLGGPQGGQVDLPRALDMVGAPLGTEQNQRLLVSALGDYEDLGVEAIQKRRLTMRLLRARSTASSCRSDSCALFISWYISQLISFAQLSLCRHCDKAEPVESVPKRE